MAVKILRLLCLLSCQPGWTSAFPAAKHDKDPLHLEERDHGYVFEGDLIMTKDQINSAMNGRNPDAPNDKRALSSIASHAWVNGVIPYEIDSTIQYWFRGFFGIDNSNVEAIKNAMRLWQEKTCVRFVERDSQKDYIVIVNKGDKKCYSWVGRQGGKQELALGDECFFPGTVVHELGHTMGMHHEQSRPDRDNYVEILWENINENSKHNFQKYPDNMVDIATTLYDYDSIMHYGKSAFSKSPSLESIRAKQHNVDIGQRDHISSNDATLINKFYGCRKK